MLFFVLLFLPFFSCLDVVILPNSHDDVGWLETISGYYNTAVKDIYTTAVTELSQDPEKTFQSVEMAYFFRWFVSSSPEMQALASRLIASGQIEFATAGWTMPDESDIDYISAINGMTCGHEFVLDAFGAKALPRFSFEVDPFGATRWIATMYAMLGYDAHIISRVNYQTKQTFEKERELEFVWSSGAGNSSRTTIFTHMMDKYSYCTPEAGKLSFYFDRKGAKQVDSLNMAEFVAFLVEDIKARAAWFKTPVLLWSWGCDFEFFNATAMFHNMDKIVAEMGKIQHLTGINVKYGHLSTYYKKINALGSTYNTKQQGDFEPYDDGAHSFWTGYYTSRPVLKGVIRQAVPLLQVAEQVMVTSSLAPLPGFDQGSLFFAITNLRRAQAEATHHDGVSGTSTTPVVQMYERHLAQGAEAVRQPLSWGLSQRLGVSPTLFSLASTLAGLQVGRFASVIVSNPIARDFVHIQQLAVPVAPGLAFSVTEGFDCQLNPDGSLFVAVPLQSVGTTLVTVAGVPSGTPGSCALGVVVPGATSISSPTVNVTFDRSTGLAAGLTVQDATGVHSVAFSQSLMNYASDGSGAYVFKPKGPAQPAQPAGAAVTLTITVGPLVSEAAQTYARGTTYGHKFRVFTAAGAPMAAAVQTLTTMGPLPLGTEAITRFTTPLASAGKLSTDSNGMYVMERQLDAGLTEPIAGNYFPLVSFASIADSARGQTLAAVVERSHGVASLAPGQLEIMMHRHCGGDGKGPDLDDLDKIVDVPVWLLFGGTAAVTRARREIALIANSLPVVAYGAPASKPLSAPYPTSSTVPAMPPNVNLLTLQLRLPTPMLLDPPTPNATSSSLRMAAGPVTALVRLVHTFDAGEDPELSLPAQVDLVTLLAGIGAQGISSIEETTLSGVWPASRYSQRMTWKSSGHNQADEEATETVNGIITLNPMDIKTFLVTF